MRKRLILLSLNLVIFFSFFGQAVPTLTCPSDTTLFNNSICSQSLVYNINCAANCSSTTIYQSDNSGYSSNDPFPLGTTFQEYTITNGTDSSTCSFNITVVDTIHPEIFCLGTQNVSANINCQATLGDYTSIVSSSDNCGTPSITQSPIPGTLISGSMNVTMYAVDASGNTDSCSFLILVDDNIPPTISCPTDSNVYIDTNCFYTLADLTGYISVLDNCDPSLTITQSPTAGTLFNIGTDPFISFNVTDISGNTSVCSYRISVIDSIPPSITCPANQSAFLDLNCTTSLPDFTSIVSSSDNCSGTVSVLQSPTAGTTINQSGNQLVSFISTDNYGNSNSCSISFNAIDTIAPVISSCINDTIRFTDSNCNYILEDFSSSLTLSDNCQNNYIFSQTPTAGTPLAVGSATLITISAADSSGNSSSCSFLIDVVDNTPPLLICPNNPNVPLNNDCQYIIPNFLNSINLNDNCDPSPSFTQSVTIGDTLTGLGFQQSIILTTSDSYGNTTSCSFIVTLTDTASPEIICPDTQYVDLDLNCLYQVPNFSGLTSSTDYCDPNPIITQSIPVGSSAGGVNTLNMISTDLSGNQATCPIVLIPNDTINPTITCPDDQSSCDPNISFISPTAFDDCGTVVLQQIDTTNLFSGSEFPIGITTLIFQAEDLVENLTTCSTQIEIFDYPSIDAGNDLTIDEGNSITIDATAQNASYIQWEPEYNIEDANSEDPTVGPLYSTTYYVNVESADGCSSTDSLVVFVVQINELIINNIITPNGDGKNDTWDINKPSIISGCPLNIINRWGKTVWNSTNYTNNWDGTDLNGNLLPDGTYYYTIKCQGEQYKGAILLIK